jgi:hypothetical protein
MYREDKINQSWIVVGGVVDASTNTVTAPIQQLGTFTLAPRLPFGEFGITPLPTSIPADGSSTCYLQSDLIYNNDGTLADDGIEMTIVAEGCAVVDADENESIDGIQTTLKGGRVGFSIRSGVIPGIARISVSSNSGSAYGETDVQLTDAQGAPSRPDILGVEAYSTAGYIDSALVWWDANPEPDVMGYKIYYDTDESGAPYDGQGTVFGEPSPVDVGNRTEYMLKGLSAEILYLSLTAYDLSGNESDYADESIKTDASEEDWLLPYRYSLAQNRPNPFNPETTIDYYLARSGSVEIAVFDLLGRKVRTLVSEWAPAGKGSIVWRGRDDFGNSVASGVYLYRLKAGDYCETKKMLLLK